jgi:hypothetical protein
MGWDNYESGVQKQIRVVVDVYFADWVIGTASKWSCGGERAIGAHQLLEGRRSY